MGKLLIWVVIGLVILLLMRLLGPGKRRVRDEGEGRADGGSSKAADAGTRKVGEDGTGADARPGTPRELMLRCAVCAVHVPSSEAVFAGGKAYCSAAHRDANDRG